MTLLLMLLAVFVIYYLIGVLLTTKLINVCNNMGSKQHFPRSYIFLSWLFMYLFIIEFIKILKEFE
jgi:Kef-type K+ transport system membrane component KefB